MKSRRQWQPALATPGWEGEGVEWGFKKSVRRSLHVRYAGGQEGKQEKEHPRKGFPPRRV